MRRMSIVLACVTLLAAIARADIATREHAFAVIVSADSAAHRLSRESVALIFRRKQNYWENGLRVQPVNLPAASALRQEFSQCILGQAPQAMEDYWRDMYFHGVLPPHVLASEEAVVLFVQSTPGAIGYVSSCPTDPRVSVVLTVGEVPNCPHRNATCMSLQDQ